MYNRKDYENACADNKKHLIILVLISVIGIAAIIYSFIVRVEWITILLTIILLCIITFHVGVFYIPSNKYKKQLYMLLNGRKREISGTLKSINKTIVKHNDLDCYTLVVKIGEVKYGDDDRVIYWEISKKMPEFIIGNSIKFTTFDKTIIGHDFV